MNRRTNQVCLAVVALASLLAGSGCALPVIEGVFDDRDFAIFNDVPENRGQSGDHVLLVFVDTDETALRTVSVDLRAVSTLPVGEDIDVSEAAGEERPAVEVVKGTLIRETVEGRPDLITVADDAVRARSIGGSLNLSENDGTGGVVGSFRVDLDDGGFLEGSFTARQ
ncbi:MAG: hypothetical protein Q8O67_10430 [Deltaproteobacteria bacterium]|nr:hypothetical protein [Deltaproteobacteria bacterium]